MTEVKLVYGPPGTGKTTYLINTLIDIKKVENIPLYHMAFLTFTTKASQEARERAMQAIDAPKDYFMWFRTIHSLCFTSAGLSHGSIMTPKHYAELCSLLGYDYSRAPNYDELELPGKAIGDQLIFHHGVAGARQESIHEYYKRSLNGAVDFTITELQRFDTALNKYKNSRYLLDFNDLLKLRATPKIRILFIDEAQDLSNLQWSVLGPIIANTELTIIAGDDDQAIYTWAGANPDKFVNCQYATSEEVLRNSYRLKKSHHTLASTVSSKITNRKEKIFLPTEGEGVIDHVQDIEDIDFSRLEGSTLVLARNEYFLHSVENQLTNESIPYISKRSPLSGEELRIIRLYESYRKNGELTQYELRQVQDFSSSVIDRAGPIWHEALDLMGEELKQFLISCMRRNQKTVKLPTIKLSTIHGAKGAQADNVVLFLDMSPASHESYEGIDTNAEHRVFYVGLTRALERLIIIEPRTPYFYDI